MSTVAPNNYPNLQGMMDDFRSLINDDGGGADGPQGGIIATNDAPFTLPFLNRAIRWVYRSLRNVGDPALVLDNYLVLGLPALAAANPAVQVSLGFLGFFDGFQMVPNKTLPAGLITLDAVWERLSNTGGEFHPVHARPYLSPAFQGNRNFVYEWRANALWMPGALQPVDLRLRCKIALPAILGANLNFATTYVPILDSQDAIVDKALEFYARRFAPDQLAGASAAAQESIKDLKRTVGRQMQRNENRRADFGEEAVAGIGWTSDL